MNLIPKSAGIGACMDVKSHKGLLYAIQRYDQVTGGRLCVLRPDLSLAATFPGIGNARQIEILEDLAVITAREDGLWLFDISQTEPRLLSHFRTVEYATGIALWKRYAFVSCRQYGVQILDISDPTAPRHISFVRVGEVQSATVSEGILYCGVWGEMKVVAVDVTNPTYPKVLFELPLQGRGDGVCVRDGILYAATGQHARGISGKGDPTDPAYGMGNGVECFDISNLASPKKNRRHAVRKSLLLRRGYVGARLLRRYAGGQQLGVGRVPFGQGSAGQIPPPHGRGRCRRRCYGS